MDNATITTVMMMIIIAALKKKKPGYLHTGLSRSAADIRRI